MTSWLALPSEEATASLAALLAPELRGGDLVVLSGELGAGKTFFAGALCHALGLDPDEPVTSPTFNLVSEYEISGLLVLHADFYRLKGEREAFELGLEERRAAGALLLVEWGLPYVSVLGGDPIEIEFSVEPRQARFPEHGPRAAELGARLAPQLG